MYEGLPFNTKYATYTSNTIKTIFSFSHMVYNICTRVFSKQFDCFFKFLSFVVIQKLEYQTLCCIHDYPILS